MEDRVRERSKGVGLLRQLEETTRDPHSGEPPPPSSLDADLMGSGVVAGVVGVFRPLGQPSTQPYTGEKDHQGAVGFLCLLDDVVYCLSAVYLLMCVKMLVLIF